MIIPNFINTLDNIKELHKRKNNDYSDDKDPFYNFRIQEYFISLFSKPRDIVYSCIVGLKIARLSALLKNNKEPNNEGIKDTFDDLICYITIWKSNWQQDKSINYNKIDSVTVRETCLK